MKDQSLWRADKRPQFPSTPLPREVDVVVIGAGITGLTAALQLKRAGKRVAVFDRDRVASGESSNTSAHLTYVTDARISELAKRFGGEAARRVWLGNATGLDFIGETAALPGFACGFQRVPGFLCAPFFDEADEFDALREDATLAAELGFDARVVEDGPVTGKPAIVFADQAVFFPADYIYGLALAVDGNGSFVREKCEVGHVMDDPRAVVVDGETIACEDIIIATHVPMVGITNLVSATLLQTKIYPYSSYVLGARFDDIGLPPGLYFDTTDPYWYLRIHQDQRGLYAIFGGADHKTGQEKNPEKCYAMVEEALMRLVPSARIERRWTGQVIVTSDGLPFIGKTAEHQYAATGYVGNGLTFGTLAGLMMSDAVLGRSNPWAALFDPHRKAKSPAALATLLGENVDYPVYYVADRMRTRSEGDVESVGRGEGKVMKLDGKRVAVHRTEHGRLIKLDATCTHMGCLVRWNAPEKSWDCPCHGSRFNAEGQVMGGPAEAPLTPIE